MKNELANQNLTETSMAGENPFFPYDRYGNYVAEMPPFTEGKGDLAKASQPKEFGNAVGSMNPTLGIG